MIMYKFNEDKNLKLLEKHIKSTYSSHYSKNKFQATEIIFDAGHGEGFCIGNIIKYALRYGKKGGHNKADLMKIAHYVVMAMHLHDENTSVKQKDDGNDMS